MDRPMSLPVAAAQMEQSIRDFQESWSRAMEDGDRVADKLAASTILTSLRYIEKHGLTDGGRKALRTAIESSKVILGV